MTAARTAESDFFNSVTVAATIGLPFLSRTLPATEGLIVWAKPAILHKNKRHNRILCLFIGGLRLCQAPLVRHTSRFFLVSSALKVIRYLSPDNLASVFSL